MVVCIKKKRKEEEQQRGRSKVNSDTQQDTKSPHRIHVAWGEGWNEKGRQGEDKREEGKWPI